MIKTVVILCGHHSGSSMLAGCLHRMGVEMEDEESHQEIGGIHPKGMWERKQFEIMNDKILDKAGGSWRQPPKEERILQLVNDEALASQIKGLVRQTQKPLWGWKDPRNALTIPVWHPHLVNPYYIVLYRKKLSLLRSHLSQNYQWKFGFLNTSEKAEKFIDEYYYRIINFMKTVENKMVVRYESMLTNPIDELKRIAHFIGVETNVEALEMIDSSLRHF